MNIHKNARLTPLRREEMAQAVIAGQLSQASAARVFGVCAKVVARWVDRYRVGGAAAMCDRSSRPLHIPRQTAAVVTNRVTNLRRQRRTGQHIALETGVCAATVSRILKRAGLSRIRDGQEAYDGHAGLGGFSHGCGQFRPSWPAKSMVPDDRAMMHHVSDAVSSGFTEAEVDGRCGGGSAQAQGFGMILAADARKLRRVGA